ncbi:flavin-containing monooxygenase [Rhodococcus koreensis]
MAGQREVPTELDAVVVGAGFAGLYMLYTLRQLGMSARAFEAGSDVGGTWYWNKYPGARCDVESMHYSYSFDPEIEQEWEWTEKYPSQPEIHAYIRHVAERHDLRRDVLLDTKVVAADFDENSGRWKVRTDRGDEVSARYCIMAVGCLSKPKALEIPGLESFAGDSYYTSSWPEKDVDFSGQRVGVIGTGSSGIQAIPILAERAAHLTVFQRTANFSLPAFNRPIDQELVAQVKENYAEIRQAGRMSGFGVDVDLPTKSALEVGAAERDATYERVWEKGNLTGLFNAFIDVLVDQTANDTAADFVRSKIREIVKDPAKAEILSPRGFPLGAKRPCLDTGYHNTFNRDDVDLVDLRATPLARITAKGVRTSERDFEFDSLVFATGFDAMTGALLAIDVTGRGGALLREKWADGPVSYLGLSTAGFPNFFTITGPGSPSVLSNMVLSIEQHVDWIGDLMSYMSKRNYSIVEPTEVAEKQWTDHVQEAAAATLFTKADSWYVGANVPGKPRVFMPYAGGVGAYREKCDEVVAADYHGFVLQS